MIKFTKMQGAGNDFILFEEGGLPPQDALARAVCDRRFGVGADGILIAGQNGQGRPIMQYYNSDGSRAAFCGNGLRCFARYARENGLVERDAFVVETAAGHRRVELHRDAADRIDRVTVEMGMPELRPYEIPVLLAGKQAVEVPLQLAGERVVLTCLRVGVPHAVLFADCPPDEHRMRQLGEAIGRHPAFPEGINLDFAVQEGPASLQIFTWERGAGPPLACGTGCCAVAEAARLSGRTDSKKLRIEAEGGTLWVERREDGLWLTGPARTICTGALSPEWVVGVHGTKNS